MEGTFTVVPSVGTLDIQRRSLVCEKLHRVNVRTGPPGITGEKAQTVTVQDYSLSFEGHTPSSLPRASVHLKHEK